MKAHKTIVLTILTLAMIALVGCSKDSNPVKSPEPTPSKPDININQPVPAELLGIWVYTEAQSNSQYIALNDALDWESASEYAAFEITSDSGSNFFYYELDGEFEMTAYVAGRINFSGNKFSVSNVADSYSGTWTLQGDNLRMDIADGNERITLFAVRAS